MKHVRKSIALLLALVLAASLLCLPALAADTVPARYARYRVYTCLGDSNAAGYAAEGYQDQPCTVTSGAYHSMVANGLGAKLNACGWSGFRSHEMRHLLDPDWEITNWEYAEALGIAASVTYDDLESRRDLYIQAVEEADLLTVNIGSNDVLSNPVVLTLREMNDTDGVDKAILDAIKAELQKTGDFGTALLKLIGYAESIGQGTKVLASLTYHMNIAYQQFKENWDAIVKNIYRLNPDVTLVVVGMHNAFANTSITVGSVVKTGKLLQPIMDKMNAWMKSSSAYAGQYGQYIFCDVPDVECGELAFTQEDFWTAYLPAVHPTAAGHRYIADRILSVLPDTSLSFEDVPEGAWHYMDVAACYYRGLMVGVTDTRFAPDMPVDRAMVAAIVHRIAGEPDASGTDMPFRDVPSDVYYTQSVLWAYHAGVVSGCSADTFCPTQAISRQDLATILYRYACLTGAADEAQSDDVLSGFTDAGAVSDYARAALAWAVENGILYGKDGNRLDPQGTATRAECAALLWRFVSA